MELYLRQRGNIFRLFLVLFSTSAASSRSFFHHFFLITALHFFLLLPFSYSPCLQWSTAVLALDVCVCVIVGGWYSSVGRQNRSVGKRFINSSRERARAKWNVKLKHMLHSEWAVCKLSPLSPGFSVQLYRALSLPHAHSLDTPPEGCFCLPSRGRK